MMNPSCSRYGSYTSMIVSASSLIDAAGASPRLARALTDAIDRKDLPGLTLLCNREVPPGKARDALLMLAQPPRPQTEASSLLARAQDLAPNDAAAAALRRLAEQTLEQLDALDAQREAWQPQPAPVAAIPTDITRRQK